MTKPDMDKVRAYNRKKELQAHAGPAPAATSRTFFDDDDDGGGQVEITVSVAGGPPVASHMPPRQERTHALAANALHWQIVEYEAMGAVLDLELNAAMPPLPIYTAIATRLKEMDDADKASIPKWVWDHISNLQKVIHGDIANIPQLRGKKTKPPRSTIYPFMVQRISLDTVAIFPVGGNRDSLATVMDASPLWNHWRGCHPCQIRDGEKDELLMGGGRMSLRGYIVITCEEFKFWPGLDHITDLFLSFDKPVRGQIISPVRPG